MRHLGLVFAAALLGCAGDSGSGPGPLRTLTGMEIERLLIGNTLVGRDKVGPFWMHYPSERSVWGLASNGDVDVGRWWISGNKYCRAWRNWRNGVEQCWLFATDGSTELLWIEPDGRSSGESTIQAGNSIGKLTRPQQAFALLGSDAPAEAQAPYGEDVPVDPSGQILLARYVASRADNGLGGIDSGSPAGSDDPGAGSSSGSSGSGGSGGNGGGSGASSSGSGSSGGGGTDGDGDGGGGDDGDGDNGKGKGKGDRKGKEGDGDDGDGGDDD